MKLLAFLAFCALALFSLVGASNQSNGRHGGDEGVLSNVANTSGTAAMLPFTPSERVNEGYKFERKRGGRRHQAYAKSHLMVLLGKKWYNWRELFKAPSVAIA